MSTELQVESHLRCSISIAGASANHVSGAFGDHDDGSVYVSGSQIGHDGSVYHSQAARAAYLQPGIDDRHGIVVCPHAARPSGVMDRDGCSTDKCVDAFVGSGQRPRGQPATAATLISFSLIQSSTLDVATKSILQPRLCKPKIWFDMVFPNWLIVWLSRGGKIGGASPGKGVHLELR
jgi:hypothetical protein